MPDIVSIIQNIALTIIHSSSFIHSILAILVFVAGLIPMMIVLRFTLKIFVWLITRRANAWKGKRRKELFREIIPLVRMPALYFAITIGFNGLISVLNTNLILAFLLRLSNTMTAISFIILIGQIIIKFYLVPDRSFTLLSATLDQQLIPYAHTFIWITIGLFSLIVTLQIWGIEPASLLAATGLIGLALSLAARDTAANLVGYFVIIAEQPFLIGDYIKTGNVTGTVEFVGWRSTKIRQPDQVLVNVPNSNLIAGDIHNWFRMAYQLFDCSVYLDVSTSSEQIQEYLQAVQAMLQAYPLAEKKSISCTVRSLQRDAIEIGFSCQINESEMGAFPVEKSDLYVKILQIAHDNHLLVTLQSQLPIGVDGQQR